jgi:hypothetical protein
MFQETNEGEIKKKQALVDMAAKLERLTNNDDFINGLMPLYQAIKNELEVIYLSPGGDARDIERARLQASLFPKLAQAIKACIQKGKAAQRQLQKIEEKKNAR